MRFQRSTVGLVLALLARLVGGPLPIRQADACPVSVAVSDDGRGGVVWERRIAVGDGPGGQVIRSTKRMGHQGKLLECARGGLGMVLDVFEDDGALVFASRRYFLSLGQFHLPIPHLMTPGRCTVTHSDEGPGRFRFTLAMRHPLWGETFHQTGVFDDPEDQ